LCEAHAGCVADCIRYGCRRRIDTDFASGFCAEWAGRLIAVDKLDCDAADILARGYGIGHHVMTEHVALVRITHIFIECHADALQEATFYLNFGQIRVDRRTDIGNSDVVYDIHLAGFLVELDFDEG